MEDYNPGLCYCNEKLSSQLGEESMQLYYILQWQLHFVTDGWLFFESSLTLKLVFMEGWCHFK